MTQVERMLPLYEAKMVHHFDPQWATFEDGDFRDVNRQEKGVSEFRPLPRYWVREDLVDGALGGSEGWLLGMRGITNSTNERTVVVSMFPRAGAGNSLPVIKGARHSWALAAVLSSFVLDFIARPKVGGSNLNFFIANQFAVPSPSEMSGPALWSSPGDPLNEWLARRARNLSTTTGWGVTPRDRIRAEIDSALFHLYEVERDDVDYIMEAFPIAKRKDIAAHGEYRTKRLILETYDAMTQAIQTGVPYESPFDDLLTEGN